MAGTKAGRWQKVALTGAVVPGLLLGAAGAVGFGAFPGSVGPATVAAQSLVGGGACAAFGAAPAQAAEVEMSIADVAEKVNPAVVTIVNLQPLSEASQTGFVGVDEIPGLPEIPGIGELPGIDELPGSDQLPGIEDEDGAESAPQIEGVDEDTLVPVGTGSGFIVDELGHVVTNSHVVAGAEELAVSLFDGTEVEAEVLGHEDILDVAILRIELPAETALPGFATFGDSSLLRAGDEVIAIGNALGSFPNTVSVGTVNAVGRSFPGEGGLTTMIQHDAEIWHGNSGGPLLNLRGEVVGVNTAGIGSGLMGIDPSSADMAFAVEGNTVCTAVANLLEDGEIVWPYLGIQGALTADGQTVEEVVEDGPSAAAGLEAGDVIVAFNDQEISRQNTLLDLLFGHEPGDDVTVTVDRDGEIETFQVTLGERPAITE